MKYLLVLDEGVLALCTKFSHWLQRLTGRTNYFLAKIGVIMSFFSILTEIFNYFQPILRYPTSLFSVVIDCLVVTNCVARVWDCDKMEEANGTSDTQIKSRWDNPTWRLIWLIFTAWDLYGTIGLINTHSHIPFLPLELVSQSFAIDLAVFYYFVAVHPLPPGKSKVRQWVESLSGVKNLEPATAKSPS